MLVKCKMTDTVRSLVTRSLKIQGRPLILCALNGRLLQLDLTFAAQNVKNSDVIVVITKQRKKTRKVRLWNTSNEVERYEESLRSSAWDLAFRVIESFKGAPEIYKSMMKNQIPCDEFTECRTCRTYGVDENATKVSTDPLPVCWDMSVQTGATAIDTNLLPERVTRCVE